MILLHVQTGIENDLQLSNMLDNWCKCRRKLFEVLNNLQQFIYVSFCKSFLYFHCSANFLTESNQIASSREKPAATKKANIRSPNMSRKAVIELLAVGVIVLPCWMKIPLVITKKLVGEFSQCTCLINP